MPDATRSTETSGAVQTEVGSLSFEFFPAKNEVGDAKLWYAIHRLKNLQPGFVSLTYGAGGSTREHTFENCKRVLAETDLKPAAHLTCVGASREDINAIAKDYWQAGIRHIVALRGDLPESMGGVAGHYEPHPEGYAYSPDLVAGLKDIADFEISVAAYPETHPQAGSSQADIDVLKQKFEAGADRALTQFFFDPELFLRFRDRCAAAGIDKPIVPGIMPVINFKSVARFASACGTTMPAWMKGLYDGLGDDETTRKMIGAALVVEMCRRLKEEAVDGFHIYTMNQPEMTIAICRTLGLRHDAGVA